MATGKNGEPQKALENNGYTTDYHDLNSGCGSGTPDIFMGWKTSSSPEGCITNIVVRKGGGEPNSAEFSDGRTYYKAEAVWGHPDLNKDAGGEYLYLYYTKDKPETGIVTSVNFEGGTSNLANPIALVDGTTIQDKAANFNLGTGSKGDNIYYSLTKKIPVGNTVPKLEEAFHAEYLGGDLYKVTLPLGCKDESGNTYVFGGSGVDHPDCYITDQNGKEYYLFDTNYLYSGADFTKSWNFGLDHSNSKAGSPYATVVNPQTLKEYLNNPGYNYFDAIEGNNSDLRVFTIFVKAKNGTVLKQFRYHGYGQKNKSGSKNFELNLKCPVNEPKAPEGMNNITLTEPVLDFNAAKPGNENVAGSQVINVVPAGKMSWAGVWDKEENKFIFAGEVGSDINQWTYNFPPQKKTKNYTLILYGENRMTTDQGMSSNPGWFAIPFSVKPVHTIESIKVATEKKTDEKGTFSQATKIQWTVNNVRQEDALETDFYLVQRAQLSDFSDAVTVGTVPVSFADTDSTEVKVEVKSDTEDVATYTVIDDLEGNSANSNNSSDGGIMYYRVVRAVYQANWGNTKSSSFCKSDSIWLNNYLTGVKAIKVEKTKNFDTESTVKVRVELMGGQSEFPEGQSPKELVGKLRSMANWKQSGTNNAYYFMDTKSDRFLQIQGDSVILSPKPIYFWHYKTYNLRAQGYGPYIGWVDGDKPKLKAFNNNSDYLFTRKITTFSNKASHFYFYTKLSDGKDHYLDDGKFSTTPFAWNVVWATDDSKPIANAYYEALKKSTIWDSKASIVIQRYSDSKDHDNGKDLVEKKIVINGEDVKWDNEKKIYYAEIEDIQTYPYTHYYYKANIDATRSSYSLLENPTVATTEDEANLCYKTTLTPVAHLTASKGTMKGRVVVEWEADASVLSGFKVERRDVALTGTSKKVVSKTNKNSFKIISRKDTLATSFVDDTADAGTLYEYRITSQLKVRQQVMEASSTVYGWNPYYGTVRGKVTLKNNAPMPSKVRVHIKGTQNVKVDQIHDANNDTIIIPGFNKIYEADLYTEDGTFEFDSIPYKGTTAYNVDVAAQGAEFILEGQPNNPQAALNLSNGKYEYSTLHYICNDTRQFSGRVLYKNSTIPVRDCQFEMNGCKVLDANGNPVVTDSKGEFSFILPTMEMKLKAVKDGHTFEDDGYILARESDAIEGKPDTFMPKADYDGLILTDNTTVRLVGRLIGGNKQGKLPIGMGLTKNNLGDNLRLVLELEGDNTSRITYFNDNPNLSSYSKSFTQNVTINNVYKHEDQLDNTNVTFEKKRIVIEPDVKTGEFCIDLAPTRYKVTEMSATGYSTLFNESEGFQVLDLSHSDTCHITDSYTYLNENIHGNETRTTTYNAKYNRIVHNPVTVTLEQYDYGTKSNYLGSEKMSVKSLSGDNKTIKIANYDKESKETNYVFGHPVFEYGKQYTMKALTHEDYYYNGVRTNAPDIVYLESGKLKVRNELVSSVSSEEYNLDKDGTATFSFIAANPEFSLKKEEALRYLTMQIETNGYYYDSEPLAAFVTGARDKGKDVMPLASFDGPINVVDVIRDPYGSGSYAWREKGTTYHWDYNFKFDFSLNLGLGIKYGTGASWFTGAYAGSPVGGALAGIPGSTSTTVPIDISIPIFDIGARIAAEYDMSLNNKISTSSDAFDVGANADVYVGYIDTYDVNRIETFSLLDSKSYEMVKPGVESGAIRIIEEGVDASTKEKYYLAISEKLNVSPGKTREFAYTQKHIVGTIIPNLVQTYESLLLKGTRQEVLNIATSTGKTQYRLKDGKEPGDEDCYETIYPEDNPDKANKNSTDLTPEQCENSMLAWADVVMTNELKKIKQINGENPHDRHSISSATSVTHTESASVYYKAPSAVGSIFGITIGGEYDGEIDPSLFGASFTKVFDKSFGKSQKMQDADKGGMADSNYGGHMWETQVEVGTAKFKFEFKPDVKVNFNQTRSKKKTVTGGSGYVLATNANGYLDIDVYKVDDYNVMNNLVNEFNSNGNDSEKFEDQYWNWVQGNTDSNDAKESKIQDYVFTVRGGAERQPWYVPDSTLFYKENGKHLPLTTRTLRIDNPKISISDPVVSNIPIGDKAIFSVRLTNESEVTSNMDKSLMDPSLFKLFLDEKSCPDGLAITMDGMPLTEGRTFRLKPGETMTKTIQVERAGKPYDYENVRLGFRDDANSLSDYAAISIHYLPASTPVKMTRPVDKWVMNTLSAKDEEGRHYLPVEVNGFNISYDNFDHIELQYKKKTEGDSKWVNMCSFYANDSLYNAASGTKEKIKSGTISYRFYGEADPVEMEYDLRAVSFCRLGTGYVTAASNVMSGLKDTRNPEIFGKPKPTNGVLTFEDVISFPFNEAIAYNYLDKTANFQITGLTNDLNKTYDTALQFPVATSSATSIVDQFAEKAKQWSDVPMSKVNRSLAGQDFTWEAMVQLDSNCKIATLFNILDGDATTSATTRFFTLNYDSGQLMATTNGISYTSKSITDDKYKDYNLSLYNKLTNVAVSFTNDSVGAKNQLKFYVDGIEIDVEKVTKTDSIMVNGVKRKGFVELADDEHVNCNAYGKINIGKHFEGTMADMRLWDKVMSRAELASKRTKVLSNSEPSLMCYWPMDEMMGNVLRDRVNGTNLYFSRQTWKMPTGQHSLRLNGEGVELKTKDTDFMRAEYNDFTLSFWTQIDSNLSKGDSVTIFNAGSKMDKQHFAIYMNKEDVIVQSGKFKQAVAKKTDLADSKWHLVTTVTNKSYNSSAMYLDGNMIMTADGDAFNGMPSSVSIGDENFYGGFDNISFWHLAIPSNSLTTVSNAAPTGKEMGLSFFMPFEMDKVNSQNIHESVFSPYNMVVKKDEDGKELTSYDQALDEEWLTDVKVKEIDNTASYPPARSFGILQNIPFTWTSTDNELQINLNKRDAEINHQYVNVTVRDVEDLAGNTLVNPQMMLVYVDRNVLSWDDPKVSINVRYGQKANFRSKIINKGGRNIAFTLENNCTWLKLSQRSGVSMPLSYDNIDMEISDGLAPGEYSTTVYAVDEDNLSSPLTINVNVEAEEPEWVVTNDSTYTYSMNIMGRVKLKNEGGMEYFDTDKRDIVGAFYNGVCIGKSNLTLDKANNPMVNLTVYGNDKMLPDSISKSYITFLLWNAATNTTSVIVPDTENHVIIFTSDTILGCPPAEPIIFTPTAEKKQTLNLEAGWNWISLNIIPKNDAGVNYFFDSNNVFSPGDIVRHNNRASELQAVKQRNGTVTYVWSSDIDGMVNTEKLTYQIYVHKPAKATVYGYEYTDDKRFVTLKANPEKGVVWCDLPYLLSVDQPINVAMSDFTKDRASVGTIIKNRKLFAVMNSNGNWVGSLEYMHPGEGYYVKYFGKDTINVKYTNTEKTSYAKKATLVGIESIESVESLDNDALDNDATAFSSSAAEYTREARTMMPVIADIDESVDFQEGDEIVAFTKGNAIGSAKMTVTEDGKQLFFISLNAEDGNVVRFAHIRGEEVLAKSYNGITYDGNGVTGTLDTPYTIDFTSKTSDNDDAYGIGGEKYGKAENLKYRQGVFIIGNEKIAK